MSTKSTEKKILFISYHFPPSLAVGGHRIKGFVRHLPMYGWKPYVLTLDEKFLEHKDVSSLSEVDQVIIFRARLLPTIRDGYLFIKKIVKKILPGGNTVLVNAAVQNLEASGNNQDSADFILKLKNLFISLFITLPDLKRNWIVPALFKAFRVIKSEEIDVVFTTGPPHSVYIIGLVLNKFTKTRWVADFRDPWMTPFKKSHYPTSRLSNAIERWLERKVFDRADLVLATTEKLSNKFKEEYNYLPEDKIKFLSNGFDREDFLDLEALQKYKIFTVSYTGSIYLSRSPEPLLQAIKDLIDENRLDSASLRVKLVGNCRFIGERATSDIVSSYGLETVVEISDYVPYKKSLEIIRKSHVALLLATNQPYQIPAKVYDYMGVGTAVLALTNEGATADVINSTGIGKAIEPNDIESIKSYICDLIISEKNSKKNPDICCPQYARENIVKTLAKDLNRIVLD